MPIIARRVTHAELAMVIVLISIVLLTAPLILIWSQDGNPWYSLYLVWSVIILLAALNRQKISRESD
jgi:uncharacterized membrane protein (DUF4010 family)